MLLLEEVNMRNNLLGRNGDNGNVATLDLSWQGRLKKLDVRGTGPVSYTHLQTLLEYASNDI